MNRIHQDRQKTALVSTKGIVASQHRLASSAGADILRRGGNAVDAAIATSFALGVVEPEMSGIGGGGYMVCRNAATGTVKVVDFGMRSPMNLNPADYPIVPGTATDLFPWPRVKEDRNILGPMAIAVPGVVAGMAKAHEAFGTVPWGSLVSPSVELAEEELRFHLQSVPSRNRDFSTLESTLRDIAVDGPEHFYSGELARRIAADVQDLGGSLNRSDLSSYEARIVDPLEIPHGGGIVYATPELTAGPTLAHALTVFPGAESAATVSEGPTPDDYAAFAEGLLEAYRIRLETMGDEGKGKACTSHFSVVDRDGNIASVTQTLLSGFGCGVVLRRSGIIMNNGIMWFDPRPGVPNSLGPSKRCLSNMCPVIFEGPDLLFALGAAGGRKILAAVAQLVSFLTTFGLDLETAFHTPRIDVSGGDLVTLDGNLPDPVRKALAKKFEVSTVWGSGYSCFGVTSAVSRMRGINQGMTDISIPSADAVSEF